MLPLLGGPRTGVRTGQPKESLGRSFRETPSGFQDFKLSFPKHVSGASPKSLAKLSRDTQLKPSDVPLERKQDPVPFRNLLKAGDSSFGEA